MSSTLLGRQVWGFPPPEGTWGVLATQVTTISLPRPPPPNYFPGVTGGHSEWRQIWILTFKTLDIPPKRKD